MVIQPRQRVVHAVWAAELGWCFRALVLTLCVVWAVLGAAGVHAQAPGTVVRTLDVAGTQRSYFLHVPRAPHGDAPLALVLMFHGGGGTPAYAERESRFSELADREGFLVAYPQGYRRSWNDGRNSQSIAAQRDAVDDIAFITALLDDVAKSYRVDSRRVYATDISNGATFSHYLGARLSTRIAAIAPVAGGLAQPLSRDFHPRQPVSVLILHGTADPLVPYAGGDITLRRGGTRGAVIATQAALRIWASHNGAQADGLAETVAHASSVEGCGVTKLIHRGGRAGTAAVLYRLEGDGHAWPGGGAISAATHSRQGVPQSECVRKDLAVFQGAPAAVRRRALRD